MALAKSVTIDNVDYVEGIGNGNDSAQNIPRYGHVPFIDFVLFYFFTVVSSECFLLFSLTFVFFGSYLPTRTWQWRHLVEARIY